MKIQIAESDAEILACFPVMVHLRELADAESFLERVRAQEGRGYRLAFLIHEGRPATVAGFRFGENLAWERHLYVDDFVSLPEVRSKGYGAALLAWLADHARSHGATELHLDSGTRRKDAHRFYEREGLEMTSLHFRRKL
ncbi:MAG: GNAT family N-acetyltransferase [Deltaproteobacteria bacterium]|nr:GNAT family N-acetyltransferase [Deltaproteobacteria bacterium]MBW2419226.1 GNAT family N-acetyltransferase [Deltaproteobacteria bacterium]